MLSRGILYLLIAAFAVLASPAVASPVAAAGTTYIVDDDISNCVNGLLPDFASISTALAAATNGDTIRVCEGDYTVGTLVINVTVTITGPGATPADDGVATVHRGGGYTATFDIDADGVTIEGLDLDLTPPPGSVIAMGGIFGHGDYLTIRDNEIRNGTSIAVAVGPAPPSSSHVSILRNNVHDNHGGMTCSGCHDSGFWRNTVDAAGGIALELRGDRGKIGSNVVTNGTVIAKGNDMLVQNNQMSAGGAGLIFGYILHVSGDPVTVTHNSLSDATDYGINATPGGISSTFAIISGNTFTQVNTPIELSDPDPNDPFELMVTIGGSAGDANTFVGSGGSLGDVYYLVEMEGSTADVNAEYNKWGLCTAAEIEQEIYHQVDDPAQGLVDFEPFIPDGCAAPTATPTPTPTPTATATVTVTTTPAGTRTVTIPAGSWANFAWTGESPAQEVAWCFGEGNIVVMYRLDAETHQFERWIRGRDQQSTMGDVARFDALLALNTSGEAATCEMPASSPVAGRTVTIPAGSWANFAWTGESSAQEVADCFGEDSIVVLYRLDAETHQFERWIRGRDQQSTMGDVAQFDALLALNGSGEAATCEMPGG